MLLNYGKLTLIGLVAGLLAGIVGGGSDALIAPSLVFMSVVKNYKSAVGISLASLIPPVGVFSVHEYYKNGDIDEYIVSPLDYHPNEKGHKVIADNVIERLSTYKVI